MFLNPQKKERYKGLLINTYELSTNQKSAIPLGITIYLFDEIKISSFTSYAEFMTRRAAALEIEAPNYFVDNTNAWQLLKPTKEIKIIAIGERSKRNLNKLIKYLCEKYQLTLDQITLGFFDKDFILTLCRDLKIKDTTFEDFLEQPKIKAKPKIIFETFVNNKWQQPIKGQPIELVKININFGKLSYRVYSKNQWLKWSTGGAAGWEGYPIEGFQFQYEGDYKLSYRCHFTNGEYSQWRATSMENPYNKRIDNFEFKIEEKQ